MPGEITGMTNFRRTLKEYCLICVNAAKYFTLFISFFTGRYDLCDIIVKNGH